MITTTVPSNSTTNNQNVYLFLELSLVFVIDHVQNAKLNKVLVYQVVPRINCIYELIVLTLFAVG